MARAVKKDHATFKLKLALRQRAVEIAGEWSDGSPFVMETHGGVGRLYDALYGARGLRGVVFEKDEEKVSILARQRPTWAVYEANCIDALGAGAASMWEIDVMDLDPYGDPWPAVESFFSSDRPLRDSMVVVANDGLRKNARLGTAWKVGSLQDAVAAMGNRGVYDKYLDVCEHLMRRNAKIAGYTVDKFAGYYCGRGRSMTHYIAVLRRLSGP